MPDPVAQDANSTPQSVQDPGSRPAQTAPAQSAPAQTVSDAQPSADPQASVPATPVPPAPVAPPEVRIPERSYDLVKSERDEPEGGFKAEGHFHPTIHKIIDGEPAEATPPPDAPALPDGPQVQVQQPASQTKVYAAIGIFLGLAVGLTLAIYFLYPGSASGTMDMGTVTSNEYGLQGHLTAKWTDKVSYNLTIEPSTPALRPAFVSAVTSSTRPLSIDVQLKDPFSAVLCDQTVLVKFDPRTVAGAPPAPDSAVPGKKLSAAAQAAQARAESRDAVARAVNLARLESLEIQREHDKDVFQQVAGTDGQVASLTSQGTMPCTKKQFDGAASWTFVPDFPVVVPPVNAAADGSDSSGNPTPTIEEAAKALEAKKEQARKRAKRDFAPVSPYSVEGIDTLIWYDAGSGTAETSAGKAFRLDPSSAAAATLKGRDFPIVIHYECDETQGCTFTGVGLGVMHARMSR